MKFISSNYNSQSGISTVTIRHFGKEFEGSAKLHPDEKYPSKFTGCQIAEFRATIKALKYERQLEKQKSDSILNFIKSCECYSNFNKEDDTSKVIYRQLNKRIKKVNDLTDQINSLLLQVKQYPKEVQIALDTLKEKKRKGSKEDNK